MSKSEGVYVAEDIELDIIPLVAGAGAPTSLQSALSNKRVIVGDPGDDDLREMMMETMDSVALPRRPLAGFIILKLVRSIPDNVDSLILAMS